MRMIGVALIGLFGFVGPALACDAIVGCRGEMAEQALNARNNEEWASQARRSFEEAETFRQTDPIRSMDALVRGLYEIQQVGE